MMRIKQVRVTPIAFRDAPLLNASGIHEPYVYARSLLRQLLDLSSGLDSGLDPQVLGGRILAEVREAADFCRYYAQQARALVSSSIDLHRRVARLDQAQEAGQPSEGPARQMFQRLATAF